MKYIRITPYNILHPDIRFLRQECRIFGKFIGTVARSPHKTTFKGLPLKLGFEELVTLIKEKSDKISLVISSSLISEKVGKVTSDMVSSHKTALDENYKQMVSAYPSLLWNFIIFVQREIMKSERERKSNLHFENLEKVSLGKRKSSSLLHDALSYLLITRQIIESSIRERSY